MPRFHRAHYGDPGTIGTFPRWEPAVDFPDTKAWVLTGRTAEFSRDPASRRHECQLGQNAETTLKDPNKDGPRKKGALGDPRFTTAPRTLRLWEAGDGLRPDPREEEEHLAKEKERPVKRVVRVGDKTSHWPRLWRTLVSDAELRELERMPREERRRKEPSNEKPEAMHPRLKVWGSLGVPRRSALCSRACRRARRTRVRSRGWLLFKVGALELL